MRIVAGKYKNASILSPKSGGVRPTSDKVRQAIFNMLHHGAWLRETDFDLNGAHVLDIFCGTGALGLEALSQGAQSCIFVDINPSLAKQNAQSLGVENVSFEKARAEKWIPKTEQRVPVNLVFMDPPYNQNLVRPTLDHLINQKVITSGTLIVIEEAKDQMDNLNLPAEIQPLSQKIYGDTGITIAYF